jgi:hypothetical protein
MRATSRITIHLCLKPTRTHTIPGSGSSSFPKPPIGLYSVFSRESAGIYLHAYETALDEVAREISYEDQFKAFIDRHAAE